MQRQPLVWVAAACLCLVAAAPAEGVRWTFEDATFGELPGGWKAAKTGEGEGSLWRVQEDDSAPAGKQVLVQTSPMGPTRMFNLCICEESDLTDVELSVQFKALSGEIDQGGGILWRCQDADNYYIARHNPLEKNFRVYKVIGGKRTQLATANVDETGGKWHTLRIVHRGTQIQCYLNDKLHLEVKDDALKQSGKVGLWTKADAVTAFDEFIVKSAEP
jgi:hypothetical protein